MKKRTVWQKIWKALDFAGTLVGLWLFLMIILILIFGGEIKIQVNWSSFTNLPSDIKYCIEFMAITAVIGFFVIRKEWNRELPEHKRQARLKRIHEEQLKQIVEDSKK